MQKRLLAAFLALCMMMTLTPFAFAADENADSNNNESQTGVGGGTSQTSTYSDSNIPAPEWTENNVVYWKAGESTGYATKLTDALTAAYKVNAGDITIVCKPGADVGTMTHAHVADNLTIYGNNAYISGGECDLEVDTYMYSRQTGAQVNEGGVYLDKDITITAYELDNLGVWGQRHTTNTVNINLNDCDGKAIEGKAKVQRVYLSGATGTTNITLTDCDFITTACAVYSNADGKITVSNCTFNGVAEPINLKHKGTGAAEYTVTGCAFTNCGSIGSDKTWAAPIRLVSDTANGNVTATVDSCTFTNTIGVNGDILLGDGRPNEPLNDVALTVKNTKANVVAQRAGYYDASGNVNDTTQIASKNIAKDETITTNIAQLMFTGLTDYVTLEVTYGNNVTQEDITAAKAIYKDKKFASCTTANEAYMALFGVTWQARTNGTPFLNVTNDQAPLYKYAGIVGSVTEAKFYIHGELAGFTSLLSDGNQIDCTVGGNHQIFRTSYSIIGVNDDGNKAKLTNGNVQAYVAGGYDSMFATSGKLTIDNIDFTSTTSTTVGASATVDTKIVTNAEMEIKNCTFHGRLYVYDNFENNGKMTYNIHDNVFDGSSYSGDSNAYPIFAQCKGGNNLNIYNNTMSGYARGINLDHANIHAKVYNNTISVTDPGRSCIQMSALASAEIYGNKLELTGGNAFTLHSKLLTMNPKVSVNIHDNTITGTGYVMYDDAKASNKNFTADNLSFTYADNSITDGISTTQGTKGNGPVGLSAYVDNTMNPSAKIGSTVYGTIAEAVGAAQDNETITLLKDVTENGIDIEKNLTIDFAGHTFTVEDPMVGSTGTETNALRFLRDSENVTKTVTLKNGTIRSDKAYILIQNYSNLTLDAMILDGSAIPVHATTPNTVRYTLSNNNGAITIKDSTIIAPKTLGVAFDVYGGFHDYGDVAVTVEGNSTINGTIEVDRSTNGENTNKNTLTINSGFVNGQIRKVSGEVTVNGGYFTTDPTAYLAKGKGLVETDVPAYAYKVGDKADNIDVDTAVKAGEPTVTVPENSGLTEEAVKNAASADTTKSSLTAAAAAAGMANDSNVVGNQTDALAALEKDKISVAEGQAVTVVVQPYLDVQVKSAEEATLKLEITAKYNVVATTNPDEIITDPAKGQTKNATIIKNGVMSVTQPIQMSIALPTSFASNGDKVYVQHKGYEYEATVANNVATFTNPHGFSEFTISKTSIAVAKIGDTSYMNFQDAVDAAKDGDVITVTKDGLSATMSGSSRTITVKNGTAQEIKVKVNGDEQTLAANATHDFTYTRPSSGGSGGGVTNYAVTVNAATNGTITADKKTAAKGTTVTITATASQGYVVDKITVVDKDGKDVAVTAKDGKYTFVMPGSAVTVTASFKADGSAGQENPFVDVKSGEYYYDAVLWAVKNGVTQGVDSTHFGPMDLTTRGQMVTFLWRYAGSPEPTSKTCPFTDVKAGSYYEKAVLWAVEQGITKGTSETTFHPDAVVLRGQAVTFLARLAGVKDDAAATPHAFTDVTTSDYFNNAVAWAAANHVTQGTSATTFSPNASCLRGQIVTFLYRAAQLK